MSYTLQQKTNPIEGDMVAIKDSEDDGRCKCVHISQLPRMFQIPVGDGSAPVGGQTVYFSQWGAYSAQAPAERRVPKMKAKRFTMNITTNTVGDNTTFTVLKNGVETALTLTYGSTETGRKTIASDIQFADGDLLTVKAVIGGNPSSAIYPKDMVVDALGEV